MDLAGLLVFASALFIAAASPGPGIAAIVARVLGRGTRGALAFTAGVALGDVVWLTVAILGLSALAHAIALVTLREKPLRLFLGGLAVTMGNPKVMVFYLALLPALIDTARVTVVGYAELVAVTLGVLAVVFTGYVVLASRARRLFTSPRALRLV